MREKRRVELLTKWDLLEKVIKGNILTSFLAFLGIDMKCRYETSLARSFKSHCQAALGITYVNCEQMQRLVWKRKNIYRNNSVQPGN